MVHRTLEQRLARAAMTWKWQSLIKATALVISLGLFATLSTGALIYFGWIGRQSIALLLIAAALVLAAITWLALVIRTVERHLDREWLAAAVERDQAQLMDRFNAAVELEKRPYDTSAAMYRESIERQASTLLRKSQDRSPFSWFPTVVHLGTMLLLMLATIQFYRHIQPFQLLAAEADSAEEEPSDSENALTIPELPDDDLVDLVAADDPGEPWGQIRISNPGRNLRITRHEDLPLLIEAAADRPLEEVFWSTSINLADESKHELPELTDPRYAVFQPTLSPAELGLGEWDLAHYRAVAVAEDDTQYQSATYFVEIIPSRDQFDQLPDAAYEQLEELTDLIAQQQQVIRETDKIRNSDDSAQDQSIDVLDALGEEENRIATSAQLFSSSVADRLSKEQSQPFRASIANARDSLKQAQAALEAHDPMKAAQPEQNALMQLANARRQLADLVRNHPDAFEPSTPDAIEQQLAQGATPADPEFAELLESLEREARETASAADRVNTLATEQQQLSELAQNQSDDQLRRMTAQQRRIARQFESVRQEYPNVFRDLTDLAEQTNQSLDRAGDELMRASESAPSATSEAQQNLQQLANELNRRQLANELAQGQSLQQRLDANRQAYKEIEQQPRQSDQEQIDSTVGETEDLLDQLQQLASEQNTGDSESPLSKELSSESAQKIPQQCDSLGQARSDSDRSKLAEGIGQSLEQLSAALDQQMANQAAQMDQQQFASELQQMQQRSESLRSARQAVQQALIDQRSIQRSAYTNRQEMNQYPQLAERQLGLQEDLQRAMEQQRSAFEPVQQETEAAENAMRQTAQSLNAKAPAAPNQADQAAQQLQKLDEALEQQQQHSGMTDQQMVREMLDRLDERLEQMASQPENVTPQQQQQTAGQCKSVGSQACQMAGQNSGGSSGGQPGASGNSSPSSNGQQPQPGQTAADNGQQPGQQPGQSPAGNQASDSASGTPGSREEQISAASDRLADAQGEGQIASAARDLQQQLQDLAAELDAQNPGGQQPGGRQPGTSGRDALRPGGQQAIQRGLAQLESAARRSSQGRLSPDANQALQQGGAADLVAGIRSHYGYNENTRAVASAIREQLQDPSSPVDMRTLQQLREQIQSLQKDMTLQTQDDSDPENIRHVDPNRFPPDYRESIQKYFETLSEQP